jgi:hypothetical protein
MRNLIYLCIALIPFLFSCNKKQAEKENPKKEKISEVMNITSYTGNALIFFKETYSYRINPHVYIIFIDEKDSSIFRKSTFDILKAIKGKCSISVALGNKRINELLTKKGKYVNNFNICNIEPDYKYFVKNWISYEGYLENRHHINWMPILNDSCQRRVIYYDADSKNKSKKRKVINIRILSTMSSWIRNNH